MKCLGMWRITEDKGYKKGSEREAMGYLRGKDTAQGFKAVNPLSSCFFPLFSFILGLTHKDTSSPNTPAAKHYSIKLHME